MPSLFPRLLAVAALFFVAKTNLFAQNLLLFNGETPGVQSCLYSWGVADSTVRHAGTWSFKASPDQWHSPGIEMHCQGAWRKDLSLYDDIQFWIKCSALGQTASVSIYAWPHTSRSVNINPYIAGGAAMDTTWRFVSIPVDSFKTAAFGMTSIDRIYFGSSPPGQFYNYWIDDVWAVDNTPNHVDSLATLGNRALEITLSERYDTTNAKTAALYRLASTDDPAYADTLAVQTVGMHWFCDDFVDNTAAPVPVNIYKLFFVLPQPMQAGKHYSLLVEDVPDMAGNHFAAPQVVAFQYQDTVLVNGSVKINQVGYQRVARKYGYLGNYLGGAGAMPLAPTVFQIRDAASHAVAFSGTPNLRGNDFRLSGETVWDCDFTAFEEAGEYYLYVPGVGRSFPFEISDSVYDEVAKICARGLFYQRCGGDLPEANAGIWHRPACHTADGVVHATCANTPLYNGETIGATKTATHGWHDAGDYGKYVASAAAPLWDLMTAYELFPQKFGDANNIPESGNGIPDLLDEVKWELDWLAGMMETDGGVYFNCATTYWPNSVPHLDTPTRNLSQKTTFTTGQAAAVFAQAARVFEPFLPVFADSCLVWSLRAWGFLQNHATPEPPLGFHPIPNQIGGGDYADNEGDIDERAWALAELYKTTGDSAIHAQFAYWYAQHEPTWGWNEFKHFHTKASYTYCTTPHPTNPIWVNSYRNSVKNGLDNYTKIRTDQTKYRNGYRSDVIEWIGWGSYAQSSQYAWEFIKGFYLWPNDSSYLTYAKLNFDTQLGANPQNTTYITGIGERSPLDPLQHTSHKDGIEPPNPGIPVFGPMSHLSFGNAWNAAAQHRNNLYPRGEQDMEPYPTLRRYYDIFELVGMSEFGVASMAKATAAYSLFTSVNEACVLDSFYLDFDGDGFGNPLLGIEACVQQPNYVTNALDCNDANAAIRPSATETVGDNVDKNCDGAETCFADADDDGYRTAATVNSLDADCNDAGEALATEPATDCNDANAAIRPNAVEIPGDEIDQNCNGWEICFKDTDDDGYRPTTFHTVNSLADTDCTDPGEALTTDPVGDCADWDAARFSGNPEICDGKDNDCLNGIPYTEADNDGDGWRVCAGDCADTNPARNPGAAEVCNGIDDNCNGQIDLAESGFFDNAPPTALCKNITVALIGGAGSVAAGQLNNGSSDDCSGTNLSFSITSGPTAFTCASLAASPFTLTLSVADQSGNAATCAAEVAVADVLNFSETGRRNAPSAAASEKFGSSAALSSSLAAAGAPESKVASQNKQGAAYLFDGAAGWAFFKKLTTSDGAALDYFGNAAALDGSTLLIGAYGDNTGANSDIGAAYLFGKDFPTANNWGQIKKIVASDGAAFDYFGNAAALKDTLALVGANKHKIGASTAQGAAYLFSKNAGGSDNWGQIKKLTAPDGAANNLFGQSVGLDAAGTLALVGASGNLSNRGAAYLFGKNTGGAGNWGLLKKLTASDAAGGDALGTSASLSSDYALVGAPNKASNRGATYLFKKDAGGADNWGQVQKLTAADGAPNERFGQSVALFGDYAYVGAPLHGGKGAVYIFQKNQGGTDNWGQTGKIMASDGASNDQFGGAIAAHAARVFVGTSLDDLPSKTDAGSAYLFGGAFSCGGGLATGGRGAETASEMLDLRCSPNPFRDELTIDISASTACHLQVFDAFGHRMTEAFLPSGQLQIQLDAADWPSGLYFAKIKADGKIRSASAVLIR